jgi:hypothetical protein
MEPTQAFRVDPSQFVGGIAGDINRYEDLGYKVELIVFPAEWENPIVGAFAADVFNSGVCWHGDVFDLRPVDDKPGVARMFLHNTPVMFSPKAKTFFYRLRPQ